MKRKKTAAIMRIWRCLGAVWAVWMWCAIWGQAQVNLQHLRGHVPEAVSEGKAMQAGTMSSKQHLHLVFQLPLRNQSDLSSFLQRLYDPSSPDYHHYLSAAEFTAKYGPTEADYQKVIAFVKSSGMRVLSTPGNHMLVEADGTVAQVNAALHVSMTEYQHPTEKRTFFAPDREPSLALSVPLQHISGLSNFTEPYAKTSLNTTPRADDASTYPPTPTGSGPYGSYIPSDFRAAYYGNGPLDGSGQTIGLVELDGYDQVDLDNFYSNIGATETVPINVVLLGGLTAPLDDGGNDAEPILDMVYAMSMTPNLSQLRVYQCCSSTYSGTESGPVLILNSIASEDIAKQISCSYGWGPELPAEDPIYEEMAAQGQTFFAATGDYGAPLNPGNDVFDDYYPADDAWVTAVSMSLLTTSSPGGAWASDIYAAGAGGGYSDGPTPVPLPSYQVGIANTSNQASTQFRNMPDVVIDGYGSYLCGGSNSTNTHQCYPNSGCTTCTNGGSSMSAPIWASMMALVNEEAANEGKPSIGFLNPALYAIGQSSSYGNDFHDIIGGSNNCCGQTYAYTAVPGYDLVSGWGTPNGPNLIADLVNQTASFSLELTSSSLSIGPNDSASTTVEVGAASGFSGNVQLSVAGLPSGVTASFDANPITTTSGLTLTSTGTVAAGTYTVSITGTSGTLTASTTLTLTVTSAQGNFTVGSTLTALTLQDGTSDGPNANNASVVTVTSEDNFAGDVTLSVNNLPSGVTASFSPADVTLTSGSSATSVMTLTATTTAPTGAATAAITGTSGSLSSGLPLYLTIAPSFSVGTTSQAFSVVQGQTATVQVYVGSQNGFSAPVTLSLTGLPSGVSASFSPPTVTPQANGNTTSTLTLTADASAPLSSASGTLTGTSGSAVSSEAVTVAVIPPPPAFTITSPSAFALNVGQNGSISVPIEVSSQLSTFNAPVTLSISNLPAGMTATFSPVSVNPADSSGNAISILTVTADSSLAIGTYDLATITGTAGAVTNTLSIYYDISGSLTTSTPVVAPGGSVSLAYAADSGLPSGSNWIGIVPHGASPQTPTPLLQVAATATSGTVSIDTTNLPAGSYDAWLYFNGGNSTLAGPATFAVGSTPAFSLTAAPTYVNLTPGSSQTLAITVSSQNGFASPVSLSISGLPSGVSGSFSPASVTPGANGSVAGILTLTATGSTTAANTHRSSWMPTTALAFLFAPLLGSVVRKRRKMAGLLLFAVGFLCLLAGPIACSNPKSVSAPTSPATVTVTGTSGSTTTTTAFTLYVQ